MNKRRRKTLQKLAQRADELRQEVEEVREEEQEYYDNMPENLKQSERGERAEEVVGEMEVAEDSLNNIYEILQEVTE